jgi:histone H2A
MADTSRVDVQKTRKIRQTRSGRAGVLFPVGRVHRQLRQGRYGERCGSGAAVYLAGVIEYLVAEVMETSGNAARDHKVKRITPRHIMLAIMNDDDLRVLSGSAVIPYAGVVPTAALATAKKETTE